jgi:NhaP-type Na+/H+ or K+/H+ antiporter
VRGIETVLLLVVLGTVVAAFAGRLRVPAPALLVIAGLAVGLLPGVPPVRVAPDVVSGAGRHAAPGAWPAAGVLPGPAGYIARRCR